ncbi:MAG TPA: CheR family methyltransferase [Myxococcales bacterium]|nr:CheR family methyltransferase [Myxococcales bacterium]
MPKARPARRDRKDDTDPVIEQVLEQIRQARNIDFRNYKRATLQRRIQRRMDERKCKTIQDYLGLLDREPGEYDALVESMLIKVTSFFRDSETWEELSQRVIPQMLSEKRPGEDIRIWCAGCATGEEAFTIAILLAEAMGPAFQNQDVKIFGTDTDEGAIAFARRGVYTHDQVRSMPPELLKNWFIHDPTGWSVRKEIRRTVVFGVNNLVSDAPISRLDLLICRNVFIYLDAQLQKRVLTRFHYALRRHGLLLLGKSELIPFAARIFEPVDVRRRIYRKDGRRDAAVSQERLVSLIEQEALERAVEVGHRDVGTVEQFHRDVVNSMRLPVIGTATDGTVLVWNSAAAALWARRDDDVMGKKLAVLALPGFGDLPGDRTAAVREGRSELERSAISFTRPGDQRVLQLAVEISPLRDTEKGITGLLYVVQDVTAVRELENELRKAHEERQSAVEELQTINEELHSANEELETTNEELQSANEELQTTNEELQSTNEELETTNEELQSTNAELDATNRELAHRTEEINSAAYVQRTMIRSLTSAVAVLDQDGRVRIWNLAAERLLGIPEDEALGQLMWTLHIPALPRAVLQKIRKSLAQNAPLRNEQVAYELPNGSEGQAMVAAVPIVDGGAPLGAVIVIEDATRMANLAAELAALKGQNGDKRNRGA